MKKGKIAYLLIGLFLVLGLAYKTYEELSVKYTPDHVNEEMAAYQAEDFTVYDREGNEVKLSDYIGKPIVMNFWASWCTPCQIEMPAFQKKYQDIGKEVEFIMVNMTAGGGETVERADAFVEDGGYTFPVVFDTGHEAAATYGASALPTTFFINEEGYVVHQIVGAASEEALQAGIDKIIK